MPKQQGQANKPCKKGAICGVYTLRKIHGTYEL